MRSVSFFDVASIAEISSARFWASSAFDFSVSYSDCAARFSEAIEEYVPTCRK